MSRGRSARLAMAIAALVAPPAFPSAGAASLPATAEVSDVRGVPLGSGGKAMVTYQVSHDVLGQIDPGQRLPFARVPRQEHPEAFRGLWADGGFMGFWLAPQGTYEFSAFGLESRLLGDAWYRNYLDSREAVPLQSGDHVELAMGSLGWDAPLPWDAPRGQADGTIEWDVAQDDRTIEARYGQAEGEMDAMFIRADLVARGGDVDAREESVAAPPLVIDLPRTYPQQALGSYLWAVAYPYTHYTSGVTMRVFPQLGKAVLQASVRGYVHEARERTLPGGAHIEEWHIPIKVAVMLSEVDDPVRPQSAVGLAQGGLAGAGDAAGERTIRVPPGGTAVAGPGGVLRAVGKAPGSAASGGDPETAADGAWLTEELEAAAAVDVDLESPVDLVVGDGRYGLTIDPDFRGQGVLAVRSLRRERTGTGYADVASIPFVLVDGEPIRLDRSRLLALRVTPVYPWVTIGHVGRGDTSPTKVRSLFHSAIRPGLVVDAAYDLGEERFALIQHEAAPDLSIGGAEKSAGSVRTTVDIRSLPGEPASSAPVHYLEIPETGPVSYGGETRTTEFAGPLDLVHGSPELRDLVVGNHRFYATYARTGYEGIATVLRAPAALTSEPSPDPSASIEGERLAIVYTPHPGLPISTGGYSAQRVFILDDPPAPPPAPEPPPLGEPCAEPQILDGDSEEPPPATDIVSAWLEDDGANLYATIRVRDVPQTAPAETVLTWSVHWRHEYGGYAMLAELDDGGKWSFGYGLHNGSYGRLGAATGEADAGADGHVRIQIPLSAYGLESGDLLRDTGAHSSLELMGDTVIADHAPDGADPTFGTGGDYEIAVCASPS